jgi:hypothetical protein
MMQALLAGRICDIVRHVQAGDLDTARNLAANTPGVDWAQRLPADTYGALLGVPALAVLSMTEEEAVVQEAMAL